MSGQQHDSDNKAQAGPRRSKCRDVFLFSHPRTASNLLARLLSDQPGWVQADYHFQSTFIFAEKTLNRTPITQLSDEQRSMYREMLCQGMETLAKARDDAIANDNLLFIKNHSVQIFEPSRLSQSIWGGALPPPFPFPNPDDTAPTPHTNPTVLTDGFLHSVQPIFIIRHPALAFESWYRTESGAGGEAVNIADKSWFFYLSYTYSRQLYDWFTSEEQQEQAASQEGGASVVAVVDADDIINKSSIGKICELCGMDPARVRYQWDVTAPKEGEEVTQRHMSFMGGLWQSTSIDQSKTSEAVDLQQKYGEWVKEFGQTVADELKKRTDEAMEDYLYLKSKRI